MGTSPSFIGVGVGIGIGIAVLRACRPGCPNGVVESDHRQRSHWGQAPSRVLRHPRPSSGSGSVSVSLSVSRSCALVVQDTPTGLWSQTTAGGAIGDKRLCACCGILVLHRGRGRYRYRYRGPARLSSRMPQRGCGARPPQAEPLGTSTFARAAASSSFIGVGVGVGIGIAVLRACRPGCPNGGTKRTFSVPFEGDTVLNMVPTKR
jgi:hypothetical protein